MDILEDCILSLPIVRNLANLPLHHLLVGDAHRQSRNSGSEILTHNLILPNLNGLAH